MAAASSGVPDEALPGEDADPTYTHFAHREAFLVLLDQVKGWAVDAPSGKGEDEVEERVVAQMGGILDHYLPLPPLLDPSLSEIVPPLVDILGRHYAAVYDAERRQTHSSNGWNRTSEVCSNHDRLRRVGQLVNWVIKVRGRKAVLPYFPSDIRYLPILLNVLSPHPAPVHQSPSDQPNTDFEAGPSSSAPSTTAMLPQHPSLALANAWALRAVLLTWLSLVLTVPFGLGAFDEEETGVVRAGAAAATTNGRVERAIERTPHPSVHSSNRGSTRPSTTIHRVLRIAIPLLDSAGRDGPGAALVLARVFARADGVGELEGFLGWVRDEVDGAGSGAGREDVHLLTNVSILLSMLPTLLPSPHTSLPLLWSFIENILLPLISPTTLPPDTPALHARTLGAENGLLRKMAVKVRGRWWIAWLGVNGFQDRRRRRRASGHEGIVRLGAEEGDDDDDEREPPDGVEEEIDALLAALGDKDTIVRYSAAKYLSRISVLLPRSLAAQIVDATLGLFSGEQDGAGPSTGMDVDANSAGLWHGVCLALAEMASRGLVGAEVMPRLLPWAIKAITFDIRRGAHSIGSNVRDAAAYLIWSLARSSLPSAIKPFANEIATTLASVACFDREVSIRRAASAAFQEHVGRMGLFPAGIEVLAKTDFYSVSVRRTAFLVAAPQVAVSREYRHALLDYLHKRTLRHWDIAIRQIGAQGLQLVCGAIGGNAAEVALRHEIGFLTSLDTSSVHGAVSALTSLADTFQGNQDEVRLTQILDSLATMRPTLFTAFGADMMLEAACRLISAAACARAVTAAQAVDASKRIIDLAMKSRNQDVQVAAADAIGTLSRFRDCSVELSR